VEQPFLNSITLTPLPTALNEEAGMSVTGIASENLWARRRRRSLFVPQRCQEDLGNAFLSHADFPKAKMKSLPSLTRERREEFTEQAAHKMMEQVLNMELSFKSYDAKECANASSNITKKLKEQLFNAFDLSGCKVVCLCYITKRAKPSLAIDSGCAWDEMKSNADKDAFVDYVYKNQDIVAVASVFVVCCKKLDSPRSAALSPDSLSAPSVPLQKAKLCATLSEPARRRQEVYRDVFVSSLSPRKKDEWMI